MIGKGAYLRQLTAATVQMRSIAVGREVTGSSPPSVFIGSWNYPHVYAGPLVTPQHGDTAVMDAPERWISGRTTQDEILGYRLGLVRGKSMVHASDLDERFVRQLQEITLSASSVESEAFFRSIPAGVSFSDDHAPFGPSGDLDHFSTVPGRWNRDLEKTFYDTDLPAADAVVHLHARGLPFSQIQKAFSTGTMGKGRGRHLVPTRWSITACDSIIGDSLLGKVKTNPVIDTWRVHEFSSLNNNYAVILMPTAWQYEWSEAFLRVLGDEELVFSDYEGFRRKTTYSPLGGCYYSCKMAVLEALAREGLQAGAIVLREAHRGYVPMGVFNVRENVRSALLQPSKEFEDIRSALTHISERFTLPVNRFIEEGDLLRTMSRQRQCTLGDFSSVVN